MYSDKVIVDIGGNADDRYGYSYSIMNMKKIEEHRLFYFLSYLNPIALIETITVEIDIRTAAMRGSI